MNTTQNTTARIETYAEYHARCAYENMTDLQDATTPMGAARAEVIAKGNNKTIKSGNTIPEWLSIEYWEEQYIFYSNQIEIN